MSDETKIRKVQFTCPLNSIDCPDDSTLANFAMGKLGDSETTVEERVANCSHCKKRVFETIGFELKISADSGTKKDFSSNSEKQKRRITKTSSSVFNPSQTHGQPLELFDGDFELLGVCLLYASPSPRDGLLSRMPSSA